MNLPIFETVHNQLPNGQKIAIERTAQDSLFEPIPRAYDHEQVTSVLVANEIASCGGVNAAILGAEVLARAYGPTPVSVNVRITNGADSHKRLSDAGVLMDVPSSQMGPGDPYAVGAHGNERDYTAARSRGAEVYDLTCIFVDKTHKEVEDIAKRVKEDMIPTGMIYLSLGGRPDHAEFRGTKNRAEDLGIPFYPVFGPEELNELFDPSSSKAIGNQGWQRIRIISQTTNDSEDAELTADEIFERIKSDEVLSETVDTKTFTYNRGDVCRTVMLRQKATREMVGLRQVNTLIVVGSGNSKNTRNLAKVAFSEAESEVKCGRPVSLGRIIMVNSHLDLPDDISNKVGVVSGASVDADNVNWLLDTIDPNNGRVFIGESDRERSGKAVFSLPTRNRDKGNQVFLNGEIKKLAIEKGLR
jgi:4-hydroxy-3-methylbut-2-enyl diphosphate reductase IspH